MYSEETLTDSVYGNSKYDPTTSPHLIREWAQTEAYSDLD